LYGQKTSGQDGSPDTTAATSGTFQISSADKPVLSLSRLTSAESFCARLHPEEVAGLILVDSTHQDQFDRIGPLLPTPFDGASEQLLAARKVGRRAGGATPATQRAWIL
jgi:hypothetical protein